MLTQCIIFVIYFPTKHPRAYLGLHYNGQLIFSKVISINMWIAWDRKYILILNLVTT
jgi:hypothetical protein